MCSLHYVVPSVMERLPKPAAAQNLNFGTAASGHPGALSAPKPGWVTKIHKSQDLKSNSKVENVATKATESAIICLWVIRRRAFWKLILSDMRL